MCGRVKLEGQDASHLQIQGHVVEGSLFLLTPDLEEIVECVNFGCTYYGTDKTESAVLYNNGPEPVSFVAILNESALGQEVVSLTLQWIYYYCKPHRLYHLTKTQHINVLIKHSSIQGVDLTKSTSAMLMDRSTGHVLQRHGGEMNDLISLVTAIPNQGVLGPYEKIPIFFRFSPRYHN